MLCIGLIIGGFVNDNNSIGIVGIIGTIVLTIYGLTSNYIKHKKFYASDKNVCDKGIMGIFSYAHKVNKLQKDVGATAFFTPAEIASGIINLREAKQRLSMQEYYYVSVIYETYRTINEKICLDYLGFLGVCNEIIANFDLVAPYYKYCGNDQLQFAKFIDEAKIEYRNKAKELLENKQLFNEAWMNLHKEFVEKFYS